MDKLQLLAQITHNYLNSGDFNGTTLEELQPFSLQDLEELIYEGDVAVLSEKRVNNVFINCLNEFGTVEEQVSAIKSGELVAIYPTSVYLQSISISEERPFTRLLMQGAEQLRILFFNVDILDLYASNPQYILTDCGYMGSICVSNETWEENDPIHSEYVKNFGVAYPATEPRDRDRAIGVFLRDLSKLNLEAQCKWRGFLLPDQQAFVMNGGFIKNLIYGAWVNHHWIFDAILEEIKFINLLSGSIGIPKLFRKEFSWSEQELIGYRIILIPSLKNYYDFISSVEKIVVNNLNFAAFQQAAPYIQPVERKKEDGTLKGSIEMLEEWMNLNYCSSNPVLKDQFKKDVIEVFRKIRKVRQVPAHELYSNQHDKSLYRAQNELIRETYDAIMILRIIFNNHPKTRHLAVPDYLRDRENIVIY